MKSIIYEFKDTGVKVEMQKVSPFVATDARAMALSGKPQPPTRVVEEDGPLKGTAEVMDKDPEYLASVRLWQRRADELLMRLQIRLGVKQVIEPENWKELVDAYRLERDLVTEELQKINPDYKPDPLPEDDMTVFILFVAVGSGEDLQEFVKEISQRSYPTGEVLENAKESFRPNV